MKNEQIDSLPLFILRVFAYCLNNDSVGSSFSTRPRRKIMRYFFEQLKINRNLAKVLTSDVGMNNSGIIFSNKICI